MQKNTLSSQGFSLLEVLIAIFVLAILGTAGYFITSQISGHRTVEPTPFKVYRYAGYNFPSLPPDFTEISKTHSDPYPTVSYTSSHSLNRIESILTAACSVNKYAKEGGFSIVSGTKNGKLSSTDYEMSCDTKNNQWEFNISADTSKPGTYNVSVMSMPVLIGSSAATH